MIEYILSFTERWLGSFPRIVISFLGVLICVLVIGALWDRRMRSTAAGIGILAGLSIVFHNVLFKSLIGLKPEQQFRLMLATVGCILLFLVVQAFLASSLKKRYVAFWGALSTSLVILGVSSSPLQAINSMFGVHSSTLVVGVGVMLLLIFSFHLSVAITYLEKRQILLDNRLEEISPAHAVSVCSGLNATEEIGNSLQNGIQNEEEKKKTSSLFSSETVGRAIRGTHIGAPLVILLASLSVVFVGMAAPEAMVGDEVTHYYMLVKQAQDISEPNFYADIPMASGEIETRRYPHSFGWHYLGALIYRVTDGSFTAVQLYQAVFLFQFLVVAYLLALSRGGIESRSALVYVLSLASLPLCLIFSVTFYQDVPMTAQVMTAFYLLQQRRWLLASLFLSFALWLKVTAVIFFPAFFILLVVWQIRKSSWLKGSFACCLALVVVMSTTWILGKTINIYGHAAFYPQEKLQIIVDVAKNSFSSLVYSTKKETVVEAVQKVQSSKQYTGGSRKETAPVIIANHPGDLRIKENYLVYGGILIWSLLVIGAFSYLPPFRKGISENCHYSGGWMLGVGASFLIITAYMVRTAPDARFFLPGIPFLLLPIIERIVHLPKPKLLITLLATLAFLQGGYVLNKAYNLRAVPDGIRQGIAYLEKNPPSPGKIFMYPEGNYRLFPIQHEWYLGYRLREFWRNDNEKRIQMLHQFGIGAIVIKKRLIASVDEEITNLGVYPTHFVNDIQNDQRFVRFFENDDLLIYGIPPDPKTLQ